MVLRSARGNYVTHFTVLNPPSICATSHNSNVIEVFQVHTAVSELEITFKGEFPEVSLVSRIRISR